ncbi:MAG: sulfate transporter CysZ [Desulfuromonas sp.]|nr:MAG: sulfate transporter CysZ [Desulfuromonas sp.]
MVKNSIVGFAAGFSYPFKAGRYLLANPGLILYVLIPFLINTVVFAGAVWFGLDFFEETVTTMIPQGDAWYWAFLYYFLWLVAIVATALLFFFLFAVVGNLIASPFNDLLSEKTELLLTGRQNDERFRLGTFLRESLRILFDDMLKIAAFIGGMLVLLILLLLPAVGPVLYSVLSIIWTALFLVIEYTGFIFARHQKKFSDQRQFIRQRKMASLGFGLGSLCLLAIPFLQFFTIPLGVVGAVHFWYDSTRQQITGGSDAD